MTNHEFVIVAGLTLATHLLVLAALVAKRRLSALRILNAVVAGTALAYLATRFRFILAAAD